MPTAFMSARPCTPDFSELLWQRVLTMLRSQTERRGAMLACFIECVWWRPRHNLMAHVIMRLLQGLNWSLDAGAHQYLRHAAISSNERGSGHMALR